MTRTRPLLFLVAFAAIGLVSAPAASSKTWFKPLDDTFGSHGKVTIGAGRPGTPTRIEALPDGRFLVAGRWDDGSINANTGSWFLERLNSDGTADTSFGADGFARFGAHHIIGFETAPDGTTFVAAGGSSGGKYATDIWALGPDGRRDKTFAGNGVVDTTNSSSPITIRSLAVDASGRPVLTGVPPASDDNTTILVQRRKRNGDVDLAFGAEGTAVVETTLKYPEVLDIGTAEDGSVIVLFRWACDQARLHCGQIIRIDPMGERDQAFGVGGVIAPPPTYLNIGRRMFTSLAVRPGGEFAAAAEVATNGRTWVSYDYESHFFDSSGSKSGGANTDHVGIRIRALSDGGYVATNPEGEPWGPWTVALSGFHVIGAQDKSYTYWFASGTVGKAVDAAPALDGGLIVLGRTCLDLCRVGLVKLSLGGGTFGALAGWIWVPRDDGQWWAEDGNDFLAGDAFPVSRVARVDVAILKRDSRLLKKGRCRWLKRDFVHYAIRRATAGSCLSPHWFKARGKAEWSVPRHERGPAPGRYTARIRVVGTDGSTSGFSDDAGMTRDFQIHAPRKHN